MIEFELGVSKESTYNIKKKLIQIILIEMNKLLSLLKIINY